MSKRLRLTVLVAIIVLGGCAELTTTSQRPADSDLVFNSYQAADTMLSQASWLRENRQPLLAASFVNINNLNNSSSLGRIIAEQVASRFAQQGFTVIEVKLRDTLFIQEGSGEFVLSRDLQQISRSHNVAAVIAGTYAVGKDSIYVSARLIRASDSLILAAYDYSLPMGPDARALVATQ